MKTSIDTLKDKYFENLSKNNIRLKFKSDTVSIRSSPFRINLGIDTLILGSFISMIVRPNSEPYRIPLILLIAYFFYVAWEDSKSINNIKINLKTQILHIYHLNAPRYFALKIIEGYKTRYFLNEIKYFSLVEKDHVKVMYAKNYIKMHLNNNIDYILIDVPNKAQALTLSNLLNDILYSKNP